MEWLKVEYPDLVPRYEEMYRRSAYAAKSAQQELKDKVIDAKRLAPKPRRPRKPNPRFDGGRRARLETVRLKSEQLNLL
jgi:hypothetical protein